MLDFAEACSNFRVYEYNGELKYNGPEPEDDVDGFIISIAKWSVKLQYDRSHPISCFDGGWPTCGLCMLHFRGSYENTCENCPIHEKTGRRGCDETPYERASDLDGTYVDNFCIKCTEDEIQFLKDLFRELYPDLPVPGE